MPQVWGIPKKQINIGIGYYSMLVTKDHPVPGWKHAGEHVWATLSPTCPNVAYSQCTCQGIPFTSKKMNYDLGVMIAKGGYRGAFPWAANYDSLQYNNTLVPWLIKGLKDGHAASSSK